MCAHLRGGLAWIELVGCRLLRFGLVLLAWPVNWAPVGFYACVHVAECSVTHTMYPSENDTTLQRTVLQFTQTQCSIVVCRTVASVVQCMLGSVA